MSELFVVSMITLAAIAAVIAGGTLDETPRRDIRTIVCAVYGGLRAAGAAGIVAGLLYASFAY